MKLPARGEFQIIEFLRQQALTAPELIRGIGDDCAVARLPAGEELLTTTDLLTEGVHFRREWTDLGRLGRKTVAVNLSDLAAMGARPRFLFLSMAIPDDLDRDALGDFFDGFLQACKQYDVVLAGGDTCRSLGGLTLSVTAQGSAPIGRSILRAGARPGDAIYVTGTLGDSALALQMLGRGDEPDPFLRQRHLAPDARVSVGVALRQAALPSAMIDISDGLIADLEHILTASAAGARIGGEMLPLSDPFRQQFAARPDLLLLALAGGEDYELLFTAAEGAGGMLADIATTTGVPITRVGSITGKGGEIRAFFRGKELELPADRGYKHFPDTT